MYANGNRQRRASVVMPPTYPVQNPNIQNMFPQQNQYQQALMPVPPQPQMANGYGGAGYGNQYGMQQPGMQQPGMQQPVVVEAFSGRPELVQPVQPIEIVQPMQPVEIIEPMNMRHRHNNQLRPVEIIQPIQPVEMVQPMPPPPRPVQVVPSIQPQPPFEIFQQPPPIQPVAQPVAVVEAAVPIPPPPPPMVEMVPFARPQIHRLQSFSTGHLPMVQQMPMMPQPGMTQTIRYPNGDIYIGQIDETGVPHGQGTYTWADGSRYVGTWMFGYKEGFGVYEDLTGYSYRGEWRRSEKSGFGTERGETMDGRDYVYEGGFLHNQRHGYGTKNGEIKVKYKFGKRDDNCIVM